MPNDISIGAIGAAFLTGVVSLLGLIISKEQKVSDFRQAWVDSLRGDVVSYLVNLNAIIDALQVNYRTYKQKLDALSNLYMNLNNSTFSITLRLNRGEKKSAEVINCMNDIKTLLQNDGEGNFAKIRQAEINMLNKSQLLLKSEWRRVRDGEIMFVLSKIFFCLMVAISFGYILFRALKRI